MGITNLSGSCFGANPKTILIWIFIISLILNILYHGLQWIFLYVNDTWWDKTMKNVSRKESMPLTKGQIMAILGGGYIILDIFAIAFISLYIWCIKKEVIRCLICNIIVYALFSLLMALATLTLFGISIASLINQDPGAHILFGAAFLYLILTAFEVFMLVLFIKVYNNAKARKDFGEYNAIPYQHS
ncbi:hypothetical protein WR25_12162 [Diploscapter pachys]|uniref:Uncharacterized protein n=1 Tax=Diploscapter pachys TaxID=2018661 RepID=A0A2A2KR16_9BILA|nr:hypothetical protein WR25_12162 [Diploscapter pachys]